MHREPTKPARFLWLPLLLLAACSDTSDPAIAYVDRISAVLERDATPSVPELPPFPARRDLRVAIPRQTIDVVEFARLHTCDMGGLVGERNSGLGRLETAGRRLLYELRWLAAVQPCIAAGETWLEPLAVEKATQLPAVLWNATIATESFARAMGSSAGIGDTVVEPMLRLADIIFAVTNEGTAASAEPLDETLQTLSGALRVGARRRAWATTRIVLGEVSRLLRERSPPVCLSGKPTPRSDRLLAVFRAYYLEAWQPRLAADMAKDRIWIDSLERIVERLSSTAPRAFADWYGAVLNPENPASEWQRTRAALVGHAGAWSNLLDSCGMAVTDLGARP